MAKHRKNCGECAHRKTCSGCPGFAPSKDSTEEWERAIEGKPVSEWPPMPDAIGFIKYDNGIIVSTAKFLDMLIKENVREQLHKS